MDKQLDSGIEKKLRGLCAKVSVANALDEELQEELFGHMEDKLQAYLSGEESVTEDDALILVREHFGDPRVVKGMLREVHAQEAGISLGRRLVAAFALLMGVGIGLQLFFAVFTLGFVVLETLAQPTAASVAQESNIVGAFHWGQTFTLKPWNAMGPVDLLATILAGLAFFAGPLLFWYVLHRWNRKAEVGQLLWFGRWPLWRVGLFATLLWYLKKVFPRISADVFPGVWGGMVSTPVLWSAAAVLSCVVWFWWADRPPRRAVNLLYAVGMFFFVHAVGLAALFVPPSIGVYFTLSQGVFEWTPHVSWAETTVSPLTLLHWFGLSAWAAAKYGLIALALYLAACHYSKRLAPRLWGRA